MNEKILQLAGDRPAVGAYEDDFTLITISSTPAADTFRVSIQNKAGKNAHQWEDPRIGYISLDAEKWHISDDLGGLHGSQMRGSFTDWREAVLTV